MVQVMLWRSRHTPAMPTMMRTEATASDAWNQFPPLEKSARAMNAKNPMNHERLRIELHGHLLVTGSFTDVMSDRQRRCVELYRCHSKSHRALGMPDGRHFTTKTGVNLQELRGVQIGGFFTPRFVGPKQEPTVRSRRIALRPHGCSLAKFDSLSFNEFCRRSPRCHGSCSSELARAAL